MLAAPSISSDKVEWNDVYVRNNHDNNDSPDMGLVYTCSMVTTNVQFTLQQSVVHRVDPYRTPVIIMNTVADTDHCSTALDAQ